MQKIRNKVERVVCVAGKNNIAINVLKYLHERTYRNYDLCIVCNKTENGENNFQRSFRLYAHQLGVVEYELRDLYDIENLIFLSMEFDQIIQPKLFHRTASLFNIHFSLLPAYKGMYTSALPIINGEKYTGVTFHIIDEGIDTGDIIEQRRFKIKYNYTCRDLYFQYINRGTQLVLDNIEAVLDGSFRTHKQKSSNSSYYSKKAIDYSNIVIDLKQTAENIRNQIRAFSFREYQMPKVYGHNIIKVQITKIKSRAKAGSIIYETDICMMISTIDFNIVLFYDRLNILLEACKIGDILKVKEICSVKEHINAVGSNGWTALIVATYNNQIEVVKYLIAVGANIFVKNYNGTNLLMYAKDAFLNTGDYQLFKLYLQLGLKIDEKDYTGKTLLDYISELDFVITKNIRMLLKDYHFTSNTQ